MAAPVIPMVPPCYFFRLECPSRCEVAQSAWWHSHNEQECKAVLVLTVIVSTTFVIIEGGADITKCAKINKPKLAIFLRGKTMQHYGMASVIDSALNS